MKILKSTLVLLLFALGSSAVFSQTQIVMSALRTLTSPSITQPYMITDSGREGLFYYDSKDVSSADNGGTILVSSGRRFKRLYSGGIDVRWFGAKGDYNGRTGTDNTAAILAAINAAQKGETVFIPNGQYYVTGDIALPLTTVKKVKFEVFGDVYFKPGAGFIIEGAYQDFRSYGLLCGMNTGATTEAAYSAYLGTGLLLKNTVNCHIEVNEIKDFKYGIHMTGEAYSAPVAGCQYNKIHFNSIHHNYAQIRISIAGTVSPSNWNNESFWYGGQLGRGPKGTFGNGGWYGILMIRDASATAGMMSGNMFYDLSMEGVEIGLKASHVEYTSFTNIRVEPLSTRIPFDLDPVTAISTKFIGTALIDDAYFAPGRIGNGTIISGTPMWSGATTSKSHMGNEAVTSVTPNKFLVTTNKWTYTNFVVNKISDLISLTGQFPTVQAMMYRINGVTRAVDYKKTFFGVKTNTAGSPLTLPPNIGTVRVEASEAKVFKIDSGDLAINGEDFLVDYLTPKFPISFVRSNNNAVLIPATQFPSAGVYRCVWVDGVYRVTKLGGFYKSIKQDGPNWTVAADTETHFVNYQWGTATVTLPPADQWPDRVITIKNLQAAKTVQVIGVSASDESILAGRGAMVVKSDGLAWNVISLYKRNLTY